MLRKEKLRRYTNLQDVSLYLNKETFKYEIHVGLDGRDPSNNDLQFDSTYTSYELALAVLATIHANDAKNDQPNLATNVEIALELDDELPEPASSPVLRRTVGFDSEEETSVQNNLMINPQNSFVDGTGLDLNHSTNHDLKPASPIDKMNFSIFSHNNPHIPELKRLDSFIGTLHKK